MFAALLLLSAAIIPTVQCASGHAQLDADTCCSPACDASSKPTGTVAKKVSAMKASYLIEIIDPINANGAVKNKAVVVNNKTHLSRAPTQSKPVYINAAPSMDAVVLVTSMRPFGTDILVLDEDPGAIRQKNRLLALFHLSWPETLVNSWILRESTSEANGFTTGPDLTGCKDLTFDTIMPKL